MSRKANDVAQLDGVWKVERTAGALPPLLGVVKHIHGAQGRTTFPGLPAMPFEVRGLSLHYKPPFNWLVDVLEPDGDDGFRGRVTIGGRTLGRFVIEATAEVVAGARRAAPPRADDLDEVGAFFLGDAVELERAVASAALEQLPEKAEWKKTRPGFVRTGSETSGAVGATDAMHPSVEETGAWTGPHEQHLSDRNGQISSV